MQYSPDFILHFYGEDYALSLQTQEYADHDYREG
jgi:hypothetical protein